MKHAKINATWRDEVGERVVEAGQVAADAGRSLWLASLGLAVSLGESAGEVFDGLVEKGRKRGHEPIAAAERAVARVRKTVETGTEKLAVGAEETLGAVLHRLGLPTRGEVDQLAHRIEKLSSEMKRKPQARRAA